MNTQKQQIKVFDWTELFVTRKDVGLLAPTPAGTKKILPSVTPAQAKERWEQMTQAQKEQRIELSPQEKQIIQNYTDYQKTLLDAYKKSSNDANATVNALEQYMFPWCILLRGHGSAGGPEEFGSIASLTIKQFLNFINFLNFSLNTKLLFYGSCYAGGQHTDPMFQYVDEDTKKVFKKIPYNLNFVVVVGAVTDATTTTPSPSIHWPTDKEPDNNYWDIIVDKIPLVISTELDFPRFFDEIDKYFTYSSGMEELRKKTLPDIISIIHNFSTNTNNIPLIRLPNTEWFKALDIGKTANIIDKKTIIQSMQKDIPFYVDKKVLLVYEPYISIPITVDPKVIGIKIIPMSLTENNYFFESIDNSSSRSNDLFNLFNRSSITSKKINYYVKTYTVNVQNNFNYKGELGKNEYSQKKIVLNNVIHSQTSQARSMFTFIDSNQKPHYYKILQNTSVTLMTEENEIEEYKKKFIAQEKKLASQFEEFKQKIEATDKSVQQKIQTPDVQTLIDERKLINALNDLTVSLNQLKMSF